MNYKSELNIYLSCAAHLLKSIEFRMFRILEFLEQNFKYLKKTYINIYHDGSLSVVYL